MAPFRNPFNRRPAALSGLGPVTDENARPNGDLSATKAVAGENERPGYAGSRASSGISITKPRKEPDEFKMSGIVSLRPHSWASFNDLGFGVLTMASRSGQ